MTQRLNQCELLRIGQLVAQLSDRIHKNYVNIDGRNVINGAISYEDTNKNSGRTVADYI